AAVDTVERLVDEHRIGCHFRRCGKILLASKPKHFAALERAHRALSQGVDDRARLVKPGAITDEVNSAAFHGGLVFERSAQLHVGLFGAGLARAALDQGALLHERTEVEQIERSGAGAFTVKTARGSLGAEKVLMATGAYSGQAMKFLTRRILPIGSFIVATEPLSKDQIASIMPTRRNAVTTLNVGNYFRLSHDDRLIFGGRARFAPSNPVSDRKSGAVLQRGLLAFFPQLAGVRIDYCWGGLVDVTQDRLPRAGQHDGLYYAAGYSGHGVQMSVHMGQVMARVMSGDQEANPWKDLDWPEIPMQWAREWFLPIVGLYYRGLDLIR
ncbi:MAG: FAD-binding oxidoreductase, partial [Hyphomicrobiales bacterium]|nr:FAD-binding oxidoreductase [Hyphomicrobiales bacterium]